MRVLLDTNVFLWIVSDDRKLSASARKVFLDGETSPLVSAASIWEIMVTASLGKLTLPAKPGQFITEQLYLNSCTLLDIAVDHYAGVASLPFHHKDPFDRLIIAQSIVERVPVLSADRLWKKYGVKNLF